MNEELKKIAEQLQECQKQCDEYLSGWKRAKADLINYQKDEAKRFEELVKFSNTELVREFISVLDGFDLATDLPKGALLIRQQLEDILKRQGIERILVQAVNSGGMAQQSDPAFHEVVGEAESDQPPGTITEEVVRGYMLNGRVIRPVKVKVAAPKGQVKST